MVRIITDSTCDLTDELLGEFGIMSIPLTVHFGEQSFTHGKDLTSEEFFHRLRTSIKIPSTAQPTPHTFEEAFTECLEKGEDVLCILLSSELSGTLQSANIAKNALDTERIQILDSRTVSAAQGLVCLLAAEKAKTGASLDEVLALAQDLIGRVRFLAGLETLIYLKKGGRLSGSAAVLGTMLNIHPILTTSEGKVVSVEKARGKKKLIKLFGSMAEDWKIDTSYPVVFAHGSAPENCESLKEAFLKQHPVARVYNGEVGPVVGTHGGPGMVDLAFIAKSE